MLFRQQLVPINVRDFFSVDILYQLLIGIPPTPIIPEQNFWFLLLLPNFPLNPYWNTFLIDPGFEYLINMGNLITSVAVVGLLFLTFLAYALKKEKFGDLFRFHDVGAKKGRTTTDFIYDFMKREFNRRKEPFPLYEVEKKLARSVNLDVDTILELINKADQKFLDFKIDGNKKRYVYFD